MKSIIFTALAILISSTSFSQVTEKFGNAIQEKPATLEEITVDSTFEEMIEEPLTNDADTGTLYVEKNENFDLLLQEYLERKKVNGYRIQLFSGSKKLDALKVKVEFMKLYPEIIPDIIYQQPNFKVRVGNYRDRLDAHKNLMLYKIDFTGAFIIKDHIKLESDI